MESTYGDRSHGPKPDFTAFLAGLLQRTFDRGGNVVIPSFAVGRTQELLYFLRQIKEAGLVHGHDGFPVYVDSPLANRSTTIFRENFGECCDEETLAVLQKGENPLWFPDLVTAEKKEESMAINADAIPKVIISASGMCDAGRIRHHLKHNLWRPECTILFVGYQAGGTLGRILLDGADEVRLFGETVQVKAEICTMGGLSGHADCDGLQTWIDHFEPRPAQVFVNHGDDAVADLWAARLAGQGYAAAAPYSGGTYELSDRTVACLAEGNRTRLAHEDQPGKPQEGKTSPAFERLLNMGKRLLVVIEHNRGGANKDLARFAGQITSLCDKWDR